MNLKIVTRKELGELYGGRTSIRRLIYCYDNNRIYKGTREAANDLYISRQTVSDYCDRKIQKPMFRLRWMTLIKVKIVRIGGIAYGTGKNDT